MKPDTKAIRALADECFRSPWVAETFVVKCDRHDYEDCPGDGEHEIERIDSPEEYPSGQVVAEVPGMGMFSKHHSAFIAAARSDVPALCDRVEELEAALREAIGALHAEYCSSDVTHHECCAAARAALEGQP